MQKEAGISREKLNWMGEIGMKEFPEPVKYHVRGWVLSEKFIKNTPLGKLKERYKDISSQEPWEIE